MTEKIETIGIDVGSTSTKLVGLDSTGQMVWHILEKTEPRIEVQVKRLLEEAKLKDIPVIATGYGRNLVTQATRAITEITCHASGIYQEFKHGGTLLDIGGQDSKVIRISPNGKVLDFVMNDKCAAGTGRFLENSARQLDLSLAEMGKVGMATSIEAPISSTCTVFAESEIISLLAEGVAVPEILRGLHRSLVKRVTAMIHSVGFEAPLMLSGGVVQNPLVVSMIAEELGEEVILPSHPQLMGALGAALIALIK